MSHDPHLGFVAAAYVLAFVVIGGMIGAVLIDSLRLKRALSMLSLPLQKQHAPDGPASQDAAQQKLNSEGLE